MTYCRGCGKVTEPGDDFCRSCGKPLVGSAWMANSVAPGETRAALDERVTPRPRGVTVLAVLAGICTPVLLFLAITYHTMAGALVEGIDMVWWAKLATELIPSVGQSEQDFVQWANAVAILLLGAGIALAFISYGLWRLRRWGYVLTMIAIGLGVLHAGLMTVVGSGSWFVHFCAIGLDIWAAVYLLKVRVKQSFGWPSALPLSPAANM
jgi:hypothetical protein